MKSGLRHVRYVVCVFILQGLDPVFLYQKIELRDNQYDHEPSSSKCIRKKIERTSVLFFTGTDPNLVVIH